MSLALKLFFVSCAVILSLAILFQPDRVTVTTPQDPEPSTPTPQPTDNTVAPQPHPINQYRNLAPAQVAALEQALVDNPNDVESRRKLLIFYTSFRPSIDYAVIKPARLRHILWMVEHAPDDPQAFTPGGAVFPRRPPLNDPEGQAAAKALWQKHLDQPNPSAAVLSNAAVFFETVDKPITEEILLKGIALYPELKWTARLGRLYGDTLRTSQYGQAYNDSIRRKLAKTRDIELLLATGEWLTSAPGAGGAELDEGRALVERALELDPNSAGAKQAIERIERAQPQSLLDILFR